MAKQFSHIEPDHRDFIERQHIFFTASATGDSRVNLSPKGLDGLRVLDETHVCYMDRTGSGNETSAHLKADGRLTVMFCAFEGPPLILRLYGKGKVLHRGSPEYADLLASAFNGDEPPGGRGRHRGLWAEEDPDQHGRPADRAARRRGYGRSVRIALAALPAPLSWPPPPRVINHPPSLIREREDPSQ